MSAPNGSENSPRSAEEHKQLEEDNSNMAQRFVEPPTSAKTYNTPKLRRFRFSDVYDVFLLRSVRDADAHVPVWGQTEALFETVLGTFMKQIPGSVFQCMQKPSSKTLADRFKRLVSLRRIAVKKNESATGITEEFGEKEALLDDLIQEIDEREEAVRVEKKELQNKEKKLIEAGERIREQALNRGRSETLSDENRSHKSNRRKTARSFEFPQANDDMTLVLVEQGKTRQQTEEKRIELERERLEFDRERNAKEVQRVEIERERLKLDRERHSKEVERYEALQKENARRIGIEEQRIVMEKEERALARLERKQMLGLIETMTKKLQ